MPLSFLSGINSCTKIKTISSSFFVLKNLFDTIKKVLFGQKKKKNSTTFKCKMQNSRQGKLT